MLKTANTYHLDAKNIKHVSVGSLKHENISSGYSGKQRQIGGGARADEMDNLNIFKENTS